MNHELDGAFISGPLKHSILEQYDVYTEKLTLVTSNKTFNIEDFQRLRFLFLTRGAGIGLGLNNGSKMKVRSQTE